MGLAGSVGGLVTPWLGKIADRDGIHSALLTLIGFAAVALVLTATTAIVERLDARESA
jgi:fucose permease